jgi:hypothetical protein
VDQHREELFGVQPIQGADHQPHIVEVATANHSWAMPRYGLVFAAAVNSNAANPVPPPQNAA